MTLDLPPMVAARWLALGVPLLVLAPLCVRAQHCKARELCGVGIAALWMFGALVGVNLVAVDRAWWSFGADGGLFLGLPADLLFGWTILWSLAPLTLAPRAKVALVAAAALLFDLAAMPLLAPLVKLGSDWLFGEALALGVALVPGLLLGRWIARDEHLYGRATLLAILSGGGFLALLPAAVLAQMSAAPAIPPLTASSAGLLLRLAWAPGAVALAAVVEFAVRGGGTALPWDGPKRVVTTGPYAYVANPMQLAITLLLLLEAGWLRSWWLAATALGAAVFSAGVADWHESDQLAERFGADWLAYRRRVRAWRPRWQPDPIGLGEARLYVAASCEPCSALGRWVERQRPAGLTVHPAETLDPPPRRLTYVHHDGATAWGVAALTRAWEHMNLAWALLGWMLRVPGVAWLAEGIGDAAG
ncbi:MAG TPA: isoprenylcysteine carboxylmethyltransferase family protein, partial [Chloroflexota bacterium]